MMNYEDSIRIPKPPKDGKRGIVSERAAQASLVRALANASKMYGFDLDAGDPRVTIVSSRREAGKAIVTYGARGRKLDAAQLAYELNN